MKNRRTQYELTLKNFKKMSVWIQQANAMSQGLINATLSLH